MTIGNTINENSHVASGVGPYNFSFKAQNITQVGVYLQDGDAAPVLQDTSTYTVTLNTSSVGGSITFNTAPTGGVNVIIHRTPDYLQNTAIPLGALDERALETALDKLAIQDQELLQRSNRSIQFPVGEDTDTQNVLPVAEARANKIAIFDASGNIAVSEDDYVDISDQSAAAVAAAAAAAVSAATAQAALNDLGEITGTTPITATGSTTARTLAARFGEVKNVKDFGAVGNGSTDDTAAIQAAIDACVAGDTVFFPIGTYNISSTLNADGKSIKFKGQMASLGRGSRISRTANIKMLSWCGTAASFIQIGGIDDLEFTANSSAYTADVIETRYATTGTFTNCAINQVTTGKGLYLGIGAQDHTFTRLFIHGPGSATNGQLHMEAPDPTDGNLNVNDNRFLGCHFEQNSATPGIQVYIDYTSGAGRNNSNCFIGCKFETNQATTNPLVKIIHGVGNQWVGCRFTGYNLAFDVTDADRLYIDGTVFNQNIPGTGFAAITNIDGFTGQVMGRHAGSITYTGKCQRTDFKMINMGAIQGALSSNSYVAETGGASAAKGKNYLRYFTNTTDSKTVVYDAAEFTGSVIQGNTNDYNPVFALPPSHYSRHKNGMTLHYRAKSTASRAYEVRARGTALDAVVATPTIGTSYAWYSASFLPEQCANLAFLMQINNVLSMGSDYLSISEWYIEEDKYYASAAPTTGTWEVGAQVLHSAPAAAGNIGWVCTTAGTPGTWKAFGTIAA